MTARVRAFALYLPQFHPIPENDAWWGTGFTEWTHVRRARPRFRGHHQPLQPGELGAYDLRDAGVRAAQAKLATEHGIEAFCYWHYWFGDGRRLLERPLEEELRTRGASIGFCLAWANETWTGVWYGNPARVLVEQRYPGSDDIRAHFRAVLPAFRDPRYVRVRGRPVFCIFRPDSLPDARAFTSIWRELAAAEGLGGIFFVALTLHGALGAYPDFDAIAPQPPISETLAARNGFATKVLRRLRRPLGIPDVVEYEDYLRLAAAPIARNALTFPSVLPNWDNTPRSSERGLVFRGSTPAGFRRDLRRACAEVQGRPLDERVIFIKSWNEWAEGNHLEPDRRFGRAYLEVVRDEVLERDRPAALPAAPSPSQT